MPTCKFYLNGMCTKDNCPYLHRKFNADTEICPEFLKGYCEKAEEVWMTLFLVFIAINSEILIDYPC